MSRTKPHGLFLYVVLSGVEVGFEGDQRATGSVVSFYEFPEGGRSGTRPTVLLDCG